MISNEHEVIQLELKYCERCGGLWVRRQGAGQVYCPACSMEVPEFPIGRRFKTHPRIPGSQPRQRSSCEVISITRRERGRA